MIRSDKTQRSVVMSIKLYYSNQTKKILIGSEKAKADFSETLCFLKDKRFYISGEVILQNFVLFRENTLTFISQI